MGRKNEYLSKVDKHIGSKIYNLRIAQGYSRKQLSGMINVSNQQLHKYEMGTNRICIGRLILIAKALGEKISYFYEGLTDKGTLMTQEDPPARYDHQRMCIEISRNFMKIDSEKHRKAINSLIKSMIEASDNANPS